MSGGGGARVSIQGNNFKRMISEISVNVGAGKFSDEFINSLLKECGMDSKEVVRRLKLIIEIKEIAKTHSNEDVHIMLKECNMDPNDAAQRLLYIDTFHEVKKKRDKRNVNVNGGTYEDYRRAPSKQWQGARGGHRNYYPSNVSNDVGGQRIFSSRKENGVSDRYRSERVTGPTISVEHNKENNVVLPMTSSSPVHVNGPTMAVDVVSNHGSTTQQSAGAVDTKKGEASKRSGYAKAVASTFAENAVSVVQGVTTTGKAAVESLNVNSSVESGSSLNENLKAVASEPVTSTVAVSDIIGRQCMPEESNPKLDIKLEKLTQSANVPVTFPDHLLVPETFKKRLTFGSLDAALDDENLSSSVEPVQENDVKDASMSDKDVISTVREDESPSHPLPLSDAPESALPSEHTVLSDSSLAQEQPKQETVPPQEASQFPTAHSTTNYGFGLPPFLGIVPPEVPEHQAGNPLALSTSAPTPTLSPSSGVAQSSLSPPAFPLFQQPFGHAYFPYGPYYPHPHYYWPPNAHHLMGHGGFPQQPYIAPPGMKFPVPPPFMQGTNAGHFGHFGIPSSYGAYGSSPAVYTADGARSSEGNEDVVTSQAQEKSINSTKSAMQQGEDAHVSAPAPNREMPNYFYNLPPPQGLPHMAAFPPAIYHHPSQIVAAAAQSNVKPPLLNQSEPIAAKGSVEAPVGPQSKSSYEEPQHAPQIR